MLMHVPACLIVLGVGMQIVCSCWHAELVLLVLMAACVTHYQSKVIVSKLGCHDTPDGHREVKSAIVWNPERS